MRAGERGIKFVCGSGTVTIGTPHVPAAAHLPALPWLQCLAWNGTSDYSFPLYLMAVLKQADANLPTPQRWRQQHQGRFEGKEHAVAALLPGVLSMTVCLLPDRILLRCPLASSTTLARPTAANRCVHVSSYNSGMHWCAALLLYADVGTRFASYSQDPVFHLLLTSTLGSSPCSPHGGPAAAGSCAHWSLLTTARWHRATACNPAVALCPRRSGTSELPHCCCPWPAWPPHSGGQLCSR